MAQEYEWGGRKFNIGADIAAKELQAIRRRQGALTPQGVVDAARPKDSPLHPAFEWNDKIAAEAHRRNQAATMIRALVVVSPEADGQDHRVFVRVSGDDDAGVRTQYVPMTVAVQDRDMYRDALKYLMREVSSASASAEELRRLASEAERPASDMRKITAVTKALKKAEDTVSTL